MAATHHRVSWRRLSQRLIDGPSLAELAGLTLVLLAADRLYQGSGPSFLPGGLLDEVAHLATGLLFLWVLSPRLRERLLWPALFSSVAIDLDHIPGYLGDPLLLSDHTKRPYPHSLLTLLVLLAFALWSRRRRDLWLGLALGLAVHFGRDLAESGSGVPLLWPLSKHSFTYPHALYVVIVLAVVAAVAARQYGYWPGVRPWERGRLRLSEASRSSHCPPTSAIHETASESGSGVTR